MKSFFFFATFLALIYSTQAVRTNLRLMVNNYQINIPIGKLSVILHGVETTKEYTFNQMEFKLPSQEVTGVTEFPKEEVKKVEVKWDAQNEEDNLKIVSLSTEVNSNYQTFTPINDFEEIIKSGSTVTLLKYY